MSHVSNDSNAQLPEHREIIAIAQLVGCKECDAIFKKESLAAGEKAFCLCCGAELYQRPRSLTTLLALVITALIVFVIANSYPIVTIELDGNRADTTLIGAVIVMLSVDRIFIGFLILMTTFIVPLINILLLLYVLTFVTVIKVRPKFLIPALRTIFLFRIWGMIEVFLIGVLVTLVKLIGMVVVAPGIALWAFAALSLLVIGIASVKLQNIWDEVDRCLP